MAQRKTVEERVIDYLRQTDDLPPTAPEIACELQVSANAVRKVLNLLTAEGRVMQVGERPGRRARTFRLPVPPEGVR